MHRPEKQKLRMAKPGARQRPVTLDRAMNRKIAGGFLAFLVIMIGGFTFRSQLAQRQNLDRLMQTWKSAYHLSDEQAARIRKIEEDYHGTGNVFSQPTHTFAQLQDHEPSISRVMNPEDGARFLADRARAAKAQPRRIRAHAH